MTYIRPGFTLEQSKAHEMKTYITSKIKDRVRIIWISNNDYLNIKPGITGIIISKNIDSFKCKIDKPIPIDTPSIVTLYWTEIEIITTKSPLEQKLRELAAG